MTSDLLPVPTHSYLRIIPTGTAFEWIVNKQLKGAT